jgi:hypothetical protein
MHHRIDVMFLEQTNNLMPFSEIDRFGEQTLVARGKRSHGGRDSDIGRDHRIAALK